MSNPSPEPSAESDEPTVALYEVWLCNLCVNGAGGHCNVPGCALIRKPAPDISILDEVTAISGHRDEALDAAKRSSRREALGQAADLAEAHGDGKSRAGWSIAAALRALMEAE